MKNTELLEILGGVDDKFYDEVLGGDFERPIEIPIGKPAFSIKNVLMPVAACLAVAAGIGVTAHFLNIADIIDPNTVVSDVAIENPEITPGDFEQCKKLIQKYLPSENIEEFDFDSISGYIDVDFDGADEVVMTPRTSDSLMIVIFDKTVDGMIETAHLSLDAYISDWLYVYDSNGERYYYFPFNRNDDGMQVSAAARIKYDEGLYSIDYPLAYGCSNDQWFFMTDCAGISDFTENPVSNISAEEFKAKWAKHIGLPEFVYYAPFDEEYPMFDPADVQEINPYDEPEKLLPKAVLDVRDMGEYKLCLIGERIYRFPGSDPNIVSMGGLSLGLIKDGKLIPSKEGFGCFLSSARDGFSQFCLDTNLLDKYIRNIFTLEDGTPIIEIRYQRADSDQFDKFGVESLFYGVKNDTLVRLYSKDCGYDVGNLGELTVDGNSLIDFANAVKYKFNTDTFGGNPFENPNFTKSEFIPGGEYPMYNGKAAAQVTLCKKELSIFGTIKLLALNAEPVTVDGIERVKYSKLFLFLDQVQYSPWAIPIGINGGIDGLIASRLDDYLVPITFVNDNGYAEELIAVYQSLDEGSAVREYAVFYNARNGEGYLQKPSDRHQACIPSGDPTYLGRDFTLSHNDWTIVLSGIAEGEKIVFDFENNMFDTVEPER